MDAMDIPFLIDVHFLLSYLFALFHIFTEYYVAISLELHLPDHGLFVLLPDFLLVICYQMITV